VLNITSRRFVLWIYITRNISRVPENQLVNFQVMTQNSKNQLPVLCRVPSLGAELTLRISHNGVTQIKTGSYRKRYVGGESVVDINGRLHLTKKEFNDFQANEAKEKEQYLLNLGVKPKKKPVRIDKKLTGENSSNEISRVSKDTEKKTGYRVNKTEVNNRLQSMVSAVTSQQKQNSYLGMLTVTFPPSVNESIAMQALNTWLTALRQKGKRVINQYLWVAEKQDGKRLEDQQKATNTIHFHLLILNRVNIVYVNRAMRTVLCNLVRDGVIDYPLSAMKRYNGVDLAKDRKTKVITNFIDPKSRKALTYYITKYVTKNTASFSHAAWSCSRGFSALFTGVTCTMNELIKNGWENSCLPDPVIITDWFLFFPWQTAPPFAFVNHLAALNAYILNTRGLL